MSYRNQMHLLRHRLNFFDGVALRVSCSFKKYSLQTIALGLASRMSTLGLSTGLVVVLAVYRMRRTSSVYFVI